jgi:hypothetical protein
MSDIGPGWTGNWLWGLPLIVTTVLVHSFGLVGIHWQVASRFWRPAVSVGRGVAFALQISTMVSAIALLHGVEAGAWAIAFLGLGALPNMHEAILYSLGAMTTYGHADIFLDPHWQMMGHSKR